MNLYRLGKLYYATPLCNEHDRPSHSNSFHHCRHRLGNQLGCDPNAVSPTSAHAHIFLEVAGINPRRQQQLATESAEIIEREILQQHMILNEIRKIELGPHLEGAAHQVVWERIGPQLRAIPLIGGFINDSTLAKFEVIAASAMKEEAGPLIDKVATQFEASVNLKQMIEDNIAAFDLDRLENIVNQVAKREFKTIERLGAVLGFIIGCIQVALFWATGSITL